MPRVLVPGLSECVRLTIRTQQILTGRDTPLSHGLLKLPDALLELIAQYISDGSICILLLQCSFRLRHAVCETTDVRRLHPDAVQAAISQFTSVADKQGDLLPLASAVLHFERLYSSACVPHTQRISHELTKQWAHELLQPVFLPSGVNLWKILEPEATPTKGLSLIHI
eukprot:TRINITY_DN2072_c0_g1_i1.p1 TRINITY_DN2072_c0_g1~~TRINITY_DN2072_c0_g1_i1.p1  ORF type:complete len:169 (+),score=37.70 TRINITY_DN2072_c0_g1_i1:173-679(+)